MEKVIDAAEAQQRFPQLLKAIGQGRDDLIIEQSGRPVAVLISIEQYREWNMRREAFFAMIDEVQQGLQDVDPSDLEADIVAATTAAKVEEQRFHTP